MLLTTGDANSCPLPNTLWQPSGCLQAEWPTWTGPCGKELVCKNDNGSMDLFGKTLASSGWARWLCVARMTRLGQFEGNRLRPYVDKTRAAAEGIELKDDIEEVFRTADIISLHLPCTDETRGLVSRELLSLLKPTAVFVNFSRGEIVDEEAMNC